MLVLVRVRMASGGGRSSSFKVVLLGEGCVGKTSVVLRYCENKFNDKHITTLQVIIYLYINVNNNTVRTSSTTNKSPPYRS